MLIFLSKFHPAKNLKAIANASLLVLLSSSFSYGANVSWTDATGNWENPANWNTGSVPNPEIDNITINGPASNVTNSQPYITICYGSINNCTFILSNGAQLNVNLIYSGDAGATATINLNNGSILNVGGPFLVAQSGIATLNLTGGAVINSSSGNIGSQSTANGSVVISDLGSAWINQTNFVIANQGIASLTIQNGGRLVANGTTLIAGGGGPATGTLNLLGTPGNQGVLETSEFRKGTGPATVNFNGGILRALASNLNFITGFTSPLTVNSGGLFIDSNGFVIGSSSSFSGTGGITKQGSGTLVLSGNNSGILGTNTVTAGTLTVNGFLGGAMIVQPGAQLSGIGTLNGPTTVSGTIAPGNGIGTLTINGSYIQGANSFYQVNISSQGQTDLINIAGTASLNSSASVNVSGTAVPGIFYRILTAAGGVTGQYRPLTAADDNFIFFDFGLSYDANNVYLQAVRNALSFASVALTPNQLATANAVENLGPGNAVYNAFVNLTDAQTARNALNYLSGEIHASELAVFTEESRYLREAVFSRLEQALSPRSTLGFAPFNFMGLQRLSGDFALWIQGLGSWGNLNGNFNTSQIDRSTSGLLSGIDLPLGEQEYLGILGGYTHSNFAANDLSSTVNSDNYHVGLYGGKLSDFWKLKLGAAYTSHNINSNRSVVFPGLSNYLSAFYAGNSAQAFGELGYSFYGKRFEIEPLVGAAYVRIARDSFDEQGGTAALTGSSANENVAYSTLGIRERAAFLSNEMVAVEEHLFIGWRYAYTDINPQARFAFTPPSSSFVISGVPIAQSSAIVDAGLEFKRKNAKHFSLRLSYIGQWASEVQDNGVAATFSWQFS